MSTLELDTITKPASEDTSAPEGGIPSPGCNTSLLDFQSVDPWEDGTLREDVGERWRPKDLDSFFTRIYDYFKERGFTCIVTTRILNVLALAFIIFFSTFLLAFVDWHQVLQCKSDSCDHSAMLRKHPFGDVGTNLYDSFVLGFTIVCCLFLSHNLCMCFYEVKEFYLIKRFVNDKLGISEREISTILWPALVDKILALQEAGVLIVKHRLTSLDIASRIMRRDNYFMAMVNKEVLDLRLPYMPFVYTKPMLTKAMEWNLNYCVMSHVFDPLSFTVRSRFVADPAALQRRVVCMGLINLVLSPFIFMFMIIYFFFKHAQEMHKKPDTVGMRTWSQLARWKIREFNELEHFFDKRINSSFGDANSYILQFPFNELAIVAKFVVFIAGSFTGVLIVLSLIDESMLLYVKIFDRNLLWYIAIFGMITAAARPFVVEKHSVFDPEGKFSKVVANTHFFPKSWRGRLHTYDVVDEFQVLFPYKVVEFSRELLSVFLVPLWLIFSLPKQAAGIVKFIHDFTDNVNDLGDVCSFAAFDFESHGNSNYGAHVRRDKWYRSKGGKMEKSFLTFAENNPNWEPSPHGQALLSTIRTQQDLSQSIRMEQAASSAAAEEPGSLHSSMEDLYVRNTQSTMPEPKESV